MTYCIGVMLDEGIIFASDSRTNAGMDNFAKFCKMTVFERRGDRVIVLLSSGNLAGTQAVIGVLNQRCAAGDADRQPLERADDVRRRDAGRRTRCATSSGAMASTCRRARSPSMPRSSSAGRSAASRCGCSASMPRAISSKRESTLPIFRPGETKYGKPIIDRVITRATPLADATKCVLVSFDSTMRSNLSVGMPIDLICYERDSLAVHRRRRFDDGDPYFTLLGHEWSEGTRQVFRRLPELRW